MRVCGAPELDCAGKVTKKAPLASDSVVVARLSSCSVTVVAGFARPESVSGAPDCSTMLSPNPASSTGLDSAAAGQVIARVSDKALKKLCIISVSRGPAQTRRRAQRRQTGSRRAASRPCGSSTRRARSSRGSTL